MASGMIIAIEGVDGTGKHTQSKLLVESLCSHGFDAKLISFPDYDGSVLGPTIKKMLDGVFGELKQVHPTFSSSLFALERFEKRLEVLQGLSNNTIFVCDRYVYSNAAHQACRLAPSERAEFIEWLERLEFGILGMPRPDVTILLDMPDQASHNLRDIRAKTSRLGSTPDQHEQDEAGLIVARGIYLTLANRLDWDVVDCAKERGVKSVAVLADEILTKIIKRITINDSRRDSR